MAGASRPISLPWRFWPSRTFARQTVGYSGNAGARLQRTRLLWPDVPPRHEHAESAFVAAGVLLTIAGPVFAGPPAETVVAWNRYVAMTERRIDAELADGRRFLAMDFETGRGERERSRLQNGQPLIEPVASEGAEAGSVDVPEGLDPPLAWIRVHSRRHARGTDVERERSDGTPVDSAGGRTGDTRLVTPCRWSASLSEAAASEPRVRRLQHRTRRPVPQTLVRTREQSQSCDEDR